MSSEVVDLEDKGGAKIDELHHLVASKRGKHVYDEGDVDAVIWTAG